MYYPLISSMNKVAPSLYTARTTAFASATAITDTTILNALNTFDLGLISNGLDTKMKAVYPFVGSTATTQKFNFMDARDLDIAFRLQFFGGGTFSATGYKPNGYNAYANTYLNDNTILSLNSAHMATYLRTNIDGLHCDIGASVDTGSGTDDTTLFSKYSNIFYPRIHNVNGGIGNSVSSLGFFMSNRVNSTEIRAFQGNTLKLITNSSINKVNATIYIAAMNIPSAVTGFYSPRETSFSSIGTGLTDTEATTFYNLVQAMQTTLSRQV